MLLAVQSRVELDYHILSIGVLRSHSSAVELTFDRAFEGACLDDAVNILFNLFLCLFHHLVLNPN